MFKEHCAMSVSSVLIASLFFLPGAALAQTPEQQIAGALQEAHRAGLTHRDIKPGNVMLGERGGVPDVAKLLDFGLVTAHNADGDSIGGSTGVTTQAGMVLGTPAYMSPEQCAGD